MTKKKAIKLGFCHHCAAFWRGRPHCGVLAPGTEYCQLDDATRGRWEAEHGLKNKRQEVHDGTSVQRDSVE